MARFFIDRPVFAWVIAIFLMVAGALSLTQIPVSQYPTIASPAINVRVVYPGATAETLHLMVTDLIGQELNGIEGLRYYEISNEANGRATITATFVPGTNQDLAAVDVQNRIKRVEPKIPEEVKQQGIQIDKANSGFLCMVGLYSPDGSRNNFDIGDFAARNVYNEIKRVPGVGTATLLASEKAMRIWVDPAKLTGLGLSFAQVNAAVREQNAQIPAGILGLRPSPRYTQNTITLVAHGQLLDAKQFENILLRSNPDGSAVRLKDVARVELGAAEYGFSGTYIGKPAASIIVQLSPTANALATAKAVRATLEKLRPYFPKTEKVDAGGKRPQVQRVDPYSRDVIKGVDGKPIVEDQLAIDYAIPYDTSPFINVSIMAVVRTLIEAVALVFVVMFLFLQNIRYTFIPIIVVPVAILGAFAVLLALGFSVNVMTMFGMVLVIGILVDDAIVVVENVERIMREERLPAREATRKAMRQITGAIVGMTLVLASVFIPMAFFPGAVGIIYRQFSLTMVAAILFSALLALSLTPALCANILKPHAEIHGTRVPLLQRIGLILSAFIVAGVSIFLTYHAPWFDTAAHWLGARLGSAVSPVELFENTEVFLRTAACILFLVGVRDLIHSLIFAPLFEGTRATPPVRVLFFIIGVALAAAVFFIGNLAGVFTDAFGDAHGHLVLQIARVLLIFAAVYFLFVALRGFQRVFETLTSAYTATTRIIVRGAFVMMVAYAAIVYGFTHFYAKLPTSFVPQEDNGTLLNLIQMPAGTSANRTTEAFNLLQKHYNSDPAIKTVAGVVGFSLAGAGENAAMMFVTLQPWGVRDAEHGRKAYNAALEDAKKRDDKATLAYLARFGDDTWKNSLARTVHDVTGWEKPFGIEPKPAPFSPGDYLSSAQVAARAHYAVAGIRDKFLIMPILPPAIPELGMSNGVSFRLQDRAAKGHKQLVDARNMFLGMLFADADSASPVIARNGTRPDGLEDSPQLELIIDREAAATMGVSFGEITQAVSTAYGSAYLNDFPSSGRMQRVLVQAEHLNRLTIEDLMALHLRNATGGMVPFGAVAKAKWVIGPTQVIDYNGYPSMRIEVAAAPGRTTGEVMEKIRDVETKVRATPGFEGFAVEWTKQSLEEAESGSNTPYLVAISLLFVFLLLAALYESWSIPFAVMLVVPIGALGAVLAVTLRAMPNDIYFLIGMIAIIGLSTKNAILIIEFAKEAQLRGAGLHAATVEGARQRFRPILMTSFAFILGVWPLFKASGAASASQRAIGTGVIGGMLAATLLGVFFIPAFYVVVRKLTGDRTSHYDRVRKEEMAAAEAAERSEAD